MHITILLQYYYNIITILLRYYYNIITILLRYYYNIITMHGPIKFKKNIKNVKKLCLMGSV